MDYNFHTLILSESCLSLFSSLFCQGGFQTGYIMSDVSFPLFVSMRLFFREGEILSYLKDRIWYNVWEGFLEAAFWRMAAAITIFVICGVIIGIW